MRIGVKYLSGSGNFFVVIDNRQYNLTKSEVADAAPILIQDHILQQNCEGVVVINESIDYDFDAWFFNPDGTTGMMCGNGGRCAIYYALLNGFVNVYSLNQILSFKMNERVYEGCWDDNIFGIYFPPPEDMSGLFEIAIKDRNFAGRYINVGNDHFVTEVSNINDIDVELYGKEIRYNDFFAPQGVNVSFYSVVDATILKIRTYERGVEKETGACGTAAIATAIAYGVTNEIQFFPITLIPTSGSPLNVEVLVNNYRSYTIEKILLLGKVEELDENIVEI